jgi:hypothetical protein
MVQIGQLFIELSNFLVDKSVNNAILNIAMMKGIPC